MRKPIQERTVQTMLKLTLATALSLLTLTILVGCGGGGGGLSDPGLSNVEVETGGARSAIIGPDGGTITPTGSHGVVHTLTLPEGAVPKETHIGVVPLK